MNYYNPYINAFPYTISPTRTGLFSNLFRGGRFSFSSLINGTQKTLNVINQTIPAIKQISPLMKNAKTMFKVMNEFKKDDNSKKQTKNNNIKNISQTEDKLNISENNTNDNGPTFFI